MSHPSRSRRARARSRYHRLARRRTGGGGPADPVRDVADDPGSRSASLRRIHEVTLPASVVLAWPLFVLAAIAMSFVSGLMIGHFLWRTIP